MNRSKHTNHCYLRYGNGGAPGLDKCYLHDTLPPLLLNITLNSTSLNFFFNEPLSTVPVGMHISADIAVSA